MNVSSNIVSTFVSEAPDVRGQRVTVVGGARSGLAVARLLARRSAKVFLTERKEPAEGLPERLDAEGIAFEFGGHSRKALEADMVVISPGVPSTIHLVQQAIRLNIPVYSEIEVASWFCPAPIVAVTGTNGKTTTTSLIAYTFERAGHPLVVAGNIGFPFSDYVDELTPEHVAVLEVSSFQLDHVVHFRPRVSVLLNVTPDHLDRYNHDFNAYVQSKFNIFRNQRETDVLVYNRDDRIIREYVSWYTRHHPLKALAFSQQHDVEEGAFVREDTLVIRMNHTEEALMSVRELALRGRHNLYNSLAAAVAARAMEIRSDIIRESLSSFEGVPHRLEFVREVQGVTYINDSKATNVNAAWYALESMEAPVVLILGGRDKGNDYTSLKLLVREKVRVLIALGESAEKILRELGPEAPQAHHVRSMEEAVQLAHVLASPGDVVLLSPACASFDMFESYEERGDTFKRLVNML